ncbi:MAG: glycosyltransferase [bacterium]|nr:glycosyltransferase [bacterium]
MHIGLITPGFSANESDWCIPALLDFVHHPPHDITFSILTLRYPHTTTPYTVYGTPVTPLGFGTEAGLSRFFLYRQAMATLRALHAQKPFDLLHGFWADEAGFIATRAGEKLNIPALVSVMGGELVRFPSIRYGHGRSFFARRMIKHALTHADGVTGGSDSLVTAIKKQFQASAIPAWRVSLGVDIALFRPDGKAQSLKGDFKILHVASLAPIKNQALLIHAFAEFHQNYKKAHLHIVGDGELKESLKALVKELNIKKAVTFHGAVPHHEMPQYYRAVDICAITSYHESQSMVALEAAACGILTVGTAVGILPELIEAGLHISPPTPPQLGDYHALADIFARLAEDEIFSVNASSSARARIMTTYSLEQSAVVWANIYEALSPLSSDEKYVKTGTLSGGG